MSDKVLVAYATKHGSTAEIAEGIGRKLRKHGLEADVRAAHDVDSIEGYSVGVVGSVVQIFHGDRSALHLLRRSESEFLTRPTWLFSSGPTGVRLVFAGTTSARRDPPPAPEPVLNHT